MINRSDVCMFNQRYVSYKAADVLCYHVVSLGDRRKVSIIT